MGLLDKILIACGLQKKASKHVKKSKRWKPTKAFLRMIHKGFRVYDGYYVVVTASPYENNLMIDHYEKFSILSKKPINKAQMTVLHPGVFGGYYGVVVNKHATYCKYITFDGKKVYRFRNRTGQAIGPLPYDELHGERTEKYYITSS